MATSKSGKKSVRQSDRRRVFNLRRLRTMRDAVKKANTLTAGKDAAGAADTLKEAYKAIDKAAKRGVIKKNTAARKQSRLAKAVNKIGA
ncbi:MAG: 30S ribosomal protein S20 [bacterium]|nr:30S ribosomal protein S20 [bacterium]